MPLVRRVWLQRLEQSLDVAVDVADDQDGQIVRSYCALLAPNPPLVARCSTPLEPDTPNSGSVMPGSYWLGRIWLRPIGA